MRRAGITALLVIPLLVAAVFSMGAASAEEARELQPLPPPQIQGDCASNADHKALVRKAITRRSHKIRKSDKAEHRLMVMCARGNDDDELAEDLKRRWERKERAHRRYVKAVLAYPGGRNPIGTNRWALPYYIVVCESGAGSGGSNLYGLLDAWGIYKPSWSAAGSAGSASFWAQSVAAYNTRQHGLGGWSCA